MIVSCALPATNEAADGRTLRKIGAVESVPEGEFFPDTYYFATGSSDASLLARAYRTMQQRLAAGWAARAPELPLATPYEALTLASIVEKETGRPADRPLVAAVFINRLRLGMKLESDPTVIYGISQGYPLGHDIRASELVSATPYNTYAIAGLPPTPICNPGKDAILAVLNPERSVDLYFVADFVFHDGFE